MRTYYHIALDGRRTIGSIQPFCLTVRARKNEEKSVELTDVVIAQARNIENETLQQNFEALLELNKPGEYEKQNPRRPGNLWAFGSILFESLSRSGNRLYRFLLVCERR